MVLTLLSLLRMALSSTPIKLSYTIVSDTTNWVICPTVSTAKYAVVPTDIWGATWIPNFYGAVRIWEVSENPPQYYNWTFYKYFHVEGSIFSALLSVAIDDAFTASVNGINCNCEIGAFNFNTTGMICDVTGFIMKGLNLLSLNCRNNDGAAGLMYQLNILASVG